MLSCTGRRIYGSIKVAAYYSGAPYGAKGNKNVRSAMALVVLMRGVNVGGHRTFRPTILTEQLKHLDVVNIGAAGTFVIRQPITQTKLRAELARRLPVSTQVVICKGREILDLMSQNPFAHMPVRPDIVHFVSFLSRRPRSEPRMPLDLPSVGRWLVKIIDRKDRFVFGQYRRDMKVISYLGTVDRLFGVPVTTRNWNTITAIAKVLVPGSFGVR